MSTHAIATLERDLAAAKTIVLDAGTGTELERRGARMHADVWCAAATLSAPDILRSVHEDYIRAGARIITTNTFSSSRNMLGPAGLGDDFERINRTAVEIALEARDRMGANDTVAVAGSMSHQMPLTAGAGSRDPSRVLPVETVAANQCEMAAALAESGADLILLEMMSDPAFANPSIEAARATGLPVWVGFSCIANEKNEPASFTIEDLGVREMLAEIPTEGSGAIGIMHTNAGLIEPALAAMRAAFDGPLMAYPDSGYFKMPNWQWVDTISPADFGTEALRWIDAGAQVVGGCCGLGVEHIEALAERLSR